MTYEPGNPNLADYAVVRDGVVENVIVWDGQSAWSPPDGTTLVPLPFTKEEDGVRRYTAGIGWNYVDGEFVDNRPTDELPE